MISEKDSKENYLVIYLKGWVTAGKTQRERLREREQRERDSPYTGPVPKFLQHQGLSQVPETASSSPRGMAGTHMCKSSSAVFPAL